MKKILMVCVLALTACSSSKKSDVPFEFSSAGSTPQSAKASHEIPPYHKLDCSKKSDHRKGLVKKVGEGCELEYTKYGETKTIASASKGIEHCEKAVLKIKTKLMELGYECK